jgi:SAM-dependent methyltransferase
MKDIYNDNTYLSKNPTWHEEDAPFKTGKIIKLLDRNSISFKTISEIGCGSGEILIQLESKLPDVTNFFGFDISKDAINIAKKKETNKIKFEIKDISNKSENCFYDLQLVIDVIEHLDNYFNFLTGIVTKSQYTIFHIPLDMCIWSLFREKILIESKDRVGHIHNFTEDFIMNILSDYGFEILDKIYTEPIFKETSNKQKFVNFIRRFLFKINKKFCTKTLGGYSILLLTKNKA